MAPELERLIELQHLDTTIAGAKARVAAHPQRVGEADARLAEAAHQVESLKQSLKTSHAARSEAEKNASMFQARLAKFKEQLSAVKTNREYTAMQHEIETAQAELGVAEEKVLERMMESDVIAVEIKAAEANLAQKRKEIEAEKAELARDLTAAQEELTRTHALRENLVARIDQRTMGIFEQVARARKGVAMCAATRDGLCSVCHVRLRPPVFQQVRQNNAVVQCESCQRILYFVPPPPPVEPPVVHTP